MRDARNHHSFCAQHGIKVETSYRYAYRSAQKGNAGKWRSDLETEGV